MLRICVCLLAMVMALGVANPVAASASQFAVWLRSGMLRGDTTYTIGGSYSDNQGNRGHYWDPISGLKWPLDVVLVSLGGRAEFGRFPVRGEITKNATSDAGQMEDTDWGIYYDARDRDDHLLRTNLNEGSGSGSAWLFDMTLRLQATKHWFASVGVSGLFIDTSGTQKQSLYAGESAGYRAEIDQTITSSQTCGSLEVGYSF